MEEASAVLLDLMKKELIVCRGKYVYSRMRLDKHEYWRKGRAARRERANEDGESVLEFGQPGERDRYMLPTAQIEILAHSIDPQEIRPVEMRYMTFQVDVRLRDAFLALCADLELSAMDALRAFVGAANRDLLTDLLIEARKHE